MEALPPISDMVNEAVFSESEIYRYMLSRTWDSTGPTINFIMLNPSTADCEKNDPTVERCMKRAFFAGYGGFVVTNIFAFRATDPRVMRAAHDPIGQFNHSWIASEAMSADRVVCAWGTHGAYRGQGDKVLRLLWSLGITPYALRLSKSGFPCHPLYLPYDCGFIELNPPHLECVDGQANGFRDDRD